MSDSESIQPTKNKPDEPNKKWPFWMIAIIWLVIAFGVPYSITYKTASNPYKEGQATRTEKTKRTLDDATREAIRAGIMGCVVAMLILAMWKLDRLAFAKSDLELEKTHMKAIICILAFLLWIIWTSSGYIMVRAYDEMTDTGTNLPGFQMD